jgi:hypothetical protein
MGNGWDRTVNHGKHVARENGRTVKELQYRGKSLVAAWPAHKKYLTASYSDENKKV